MKINHQETIKRCKLLNMAELARQCGTHRPVVLQVIQGIYPYMGNTRSTQILNRLREMNLLVEEPEADIDKAA